VKIRPMADYECQPLWEIREDGTRNVPVSQLNISPALADELLAWARRYDETLDREDPAASKFGSEEEKQDFERLGRRLWQALATELGARVKVTYFSETDQRELDVPC
jgi:hypothetical protein